MMTTHSFETTPIHFSVPKQTGDVLPLRFDTLPTPWSMGRFTLLLLASSFSSSTNSSSLSSLLRFRLFLNWTFLSVTLSPRNHRVPEIVLARCEDPCTDPVSVIGYASSSSFVLTVPQVVTRV